MRDNTLDTRRFNNISAFVQLYDSVSKDAIETCTPLVLQIDTLSITPDFIEDTNNFETIIPDNAINRATLALLCNFKPRNVDVDNTGFRLFDLAIPAETFLYSDDEGAINALKGKTAVYRLCRVNFHQIGDANNTLCFSNNEVQTIIYQENTWALEVRNLTTREQKDIQSYNAMFVANAFVPSKY